jgi:hypothetical protein
LNGGISNAANSLAIINLLYSQLKVAGDRIKDTYAEFNNDKIDYNAAADEIMTNKPNTIINKQLDIMESTRKDNLTGLKSYLDSQLSSANMILNNSNQSLYRLPTLQQVQYYKSELSRIQRGGYNSGPPPTNPVIPYQKELDGYTKQAQPYVDNSVREYDYKLSVIKNIITSTQNGISQALILMNGSVGPGPSDLTKVTNSDIGKAIANSISASNRLVTINTRLSEMKSLQDNIIFNVNALKGAKKEYLDGAKITNVMLDKFVTDTAGLMASAQSLATEVTASLKVYQKFTLAQLSAQITSIYNMYTALEGKKNFNTSDMTPINETLASIRKVVGNSNSITQKGDGTGAAAYKNNSIYGNWSFSLKRSMGTV